VLEVVENLWAVGAPPDAGGVTGRRAGYNVPHFWSVWVQRGTMQYQNWVKHFNEIIFSASFSFKVAIL